MNLWFGGKRLIQKAGHVSFADNPGRPKRFLVEIGGQLAGSGAFLPPIRPGGRNVGVTRGPAIIGNGWPASAG